MQRQAAHVLALGHAVGDALAVEFAFDLLQPKVNIDRFGAKRCTAGAIVFPMVSQRVARSRQGSGGRRRARRCWRTGVALNGREVLFSSDTEGGNAIRGHEGEFLNVVFCLEQEDFAGRVDPVTV